MTWALKDTWTITRRALMHWRQSPAPVLFGIAFSVMTVLLFNYVLGGGMTVHGGGDYLDFLIPGMLAMTMFFGIETTAMAVHTDTMKGVTDRFRTMPMSGVAVVAGRAIADMLLATVILAALLGVGLLMGWGFDEGAGNAAAAVGLLLLLRFAIIWVGVHLGLMIKSAEGVAALQTIVWPFAFLSSVLASPQDMPGVLGTIAEWNPLSSTAVAIRDLFGNPGAVADSWVTEHAILMAVLWPLAITALFIPLAVAKWRSLGD